MPEHPVDLPTVVLAGGGSRRFGGQDKTRVLLGGISLLDRVLAQLAGPVVVVGPARPTSRAVQFTVEQPPGGGPLAGLAAGLTALEALSALEDPEPGTDQHVLLLAADLPFLTGQALRELRRAARRGSGALAVDDEGRDQPLLSCWDLAALRSVLPSRPDGGRLRVLSRALTPERVRLAGEPPPWWDCDTPEAYAQAQHWLGETPTEPGQAQPPSAD